MSGDPPTTGPEPYASLYARGIAVGHSDIRTDTLEFAFRAKRFTVPTMCAYGPEAIASYNGYFYTARVDDLRKLGRLAIQSVKHG